MNYDVVGEHEEAS